MRDGIRELGFLVAEMPLLAGKVWRYDECPRAAAASRRSWASTVAIANFVRTTIAERLAGARSQHLDVLCLGQLLILAGQGFSVPLRAAGAAVLLRTFVA